MGNHPEPPDLRVTVAAIATAWPHWEATGAFTPWGFLAGVDRVGRLEPSSLLAHPIAALSALARGGGVPGAWWAAGVATTGVARPLTGPGPPRPVAVVWVCARDGRGISWLREPGQGPRVDLHYPGGPTGAGGRGMQLLRAVVASI